MEQDILIRRLNGGDAQAWWRLRLEALENEPKSFGESPEEHRLTAVEDAATRLAEGAHGSFVLGAFLADRLIGTVGLFHERRKKKLHQGALWGVYVTPQYRGRGISRRLMVETVAAAREIPELEMIVLSTNRDMAPAPALYRSLGFEQWGVLPAALKVCGSEVDEIYMYLRLDKPKQD